jgi:hypothetical protein
VCYKISSGWCRPVTKASLIGILCHLSKSLSIVVQILSVVGMEFYQSPFGNFIPLGVVDLTLMHSFVEVMRQGSGGPQRG